MKHRTPHLIRSFAILLAAPFFNSSLLAVPIRVLAWDMDIAERQLAIGDSKGNTKIVAMHPSKRTAVYQVAPGGDTPPVVVALDKKDAQGKPLASPFKIPDGVKSPLLIILPDAKAPSGLRTFVLDDDTSGFSWGTTRFINATPKELVFVYDKKSLALPPSWNPVQLDPGGESRNIGVKLFFRDHPERAFYSGVWEQSPDVRKLVFLVPGDDPTINPVSFKMIPEDRRVVKAEAEAAEKGGKP